MNVVTDRPAAATRGRRDISRRLLVLTALTSLGGCALSVLSGWPVWAQLLVTLLPAAPLAMSELRWTYRHYGLLALFYLLAITQVGHFIEHVVQLLQIHVLHRAAPHAHGLVGQLDVEWVHFVWNTWVLVAAVVLAVAFPANRWLWAVVAVAAWHEVEHAYLIAIYLRDGVGGSPGLLAEGGALAGGLPIKRPDLHFLYNLVETVPLVVAFAVQLRSTYNRWLARALPDFSPEQLRALTPLARPVRFPAGTEIVAQGEMPPRSYVLVRGTADVVRRDLRGRVVRLAVLGPGQELRHSCSPVGCAVPSGASIVARTAVEVLAVEWDIISRLCAARASTGTNGGGANGHSRLLPPVDGDGVTVVNSDGHDHVAVVAGTATASR